MKPDETILLYVGMSRKIHTSSQKSRDAKRGSSENNRKQARGEKYDETKKHRQKKKKGK